MELDAKQRVLCAIYVEYQKDLPDMEKNVTAEALQMPEDVFMVAVVKLDNEKLINNANIIPVDQEVLPIAVFLSGVMMSRDGIEYVENKLGIEKDRTGKEKVQTFQEKCREFVWNALTDVAAKALAEMAMQAISK